MAQGGLARDLSVAEIARIDFYAACLGAFPQQVTLADGGSATAWLHPSEATADMPWDEPRWVKRWAAITTATAGDVMALFGQRSAAEVRPRLGAMMVRGASRLRAADGSAHLRHKAGSGDVVVERRSQPYARYFAVEEYDLSYRRFDGTMSEPVNRAAFISGDAVTVLPYDPERDRVLVIEQFRAGPFARGDAEPWSLEAIAGRIDAGETPEEAARREALEEAALPLGELLHVAAYYPSPGAKAEYLYSYVALCDLPDGVAGTFGLAEESEDIRGHLMPFDRLMALIGTGEAANAPLVLTAFWLAQARARLRP